MATRLTVNLIGGTYQEELTPNGVIATATRIAIVDGLTDGSNRQSATALIRAQSIVQASYPLGQIYDPKKPFCQLLTYRSLGMDEDSSAVRVELGYKTIVGQQQDWPAGGVAWTVEDDGYIQETTTQLDPKTHKPIRIHYDAKKDTGVGDGGDGGQAVVLENFQGRKSNSPALVKDAIATLTYPEPVRRVVLGGVVPKAMVAKLRRQTRRVNEDQWSGLEKGHWRFTRLNSSGIAGIPFRSVKIELDGLEEIDWSTYALLHDRHDGEFKADDKDVKKFRDGKYQYGVQYGNGVVKAGFYQTTKFTALFGLSDIDDL